MNFLLVLMALLIIVTIINKSVNDYISKFVLLTFSGYWGVSLGASTFSPYGIYEIHTSSYILLLLGFLSFAFGMSTVRYKSIKMEVNRSYFDNCISSILSSKVFLCLLLFSIIYLFKYATIAIAVASLQGHADVTDQFNLIFQGNDLAQQIYGYLLTPLFHVSLVLMSYYVINFKRIGLKYLLQFIVCLLNLLIFIAIGGGRSTVVIVALYLLIVYVFFAPSKSLFKFSFKKSFYLVLVTFLVIYAVSLVTNYRDAGTFFIEDKTESDGQGLELLTRYSLLPYVMFDYGMQHDYLGKFGLQLGKASFLGFDFWLYLPMRILGFPYETSINVVDYLEETWIPYDKSGTVANYAYTGLMYHYLDFGIIGVILLPFIFGIVFRRIIISSYKYTTFSSLLLLSMCFFLTMHSIFTCYLIKPWTGLYLTLLFILNFFEKKKLLGSTRSRFERSKSICE